MVVACNNIVPAFRQHCRHGVGVLGPQIIRSFVILGRRRLHATAGRLDDTKPPTPADILTTLYRTRQILPSALSQNQARPWDSVLQRAGDILSGVQPHKPRIAILGLDDLSKSREIVSALVEDPLSSDPQAVAALRNRPQPNAPFTISDDELEQTPLSLRFNSPWLKRLNAEIIEIPTTFPNALPLLHDSDIQLVVASPNFPSLPTNFHTLLSRPSFFLVLQYPTIDQTIQNYTLTRLGQLEPTVIDSLKTRTSFVYSRMALEALDIFRRGSSSMEAVQTFQHDILASGIPDLAARITKELSKDTKALKDQYASAVLSAALETCRETTKTSVVVAETVQKSADVLRSTAISNREDAFDEVLGRDEPSVVEAAVQKSTKEMRAFMRTLPWWKLPFRIDDLGHLISAAVEQAWCPDLRAKLEFQTGRLHSKKALLTSQTFATLVSLPPSYHSSVLTNELEQIASRPPEVGPAMLTYPISYRLQQIQQPILKFHRHAQRSVILLWTTSMGSFGGAYAAWLFDYLDGSTALGLGCLSFVLGLRMFIGRWEKGQKRWWMDWNRAGEGLERDVTKSLTTLLDEKVLNVPLRASEALEGMVMGRREEADKINQELDLVSSGKEPWLTTDSTVSSTRLEK